jgi:hypothetical protein
VPKKLVKALFVLVIVGAALGGAAAVGSTLFENPPRDAAEFAQWVERGSEHIDPREAQERAARLARLKKRAAERKQRKAKRSGPTPAERRYGRTLSAWCAEQERDVDALGYPYDAEAWLDRWLALSRSWRARVAALDAPVRFNEERRRYLGSWERLESISIQLVHANVRGDSVSSLEIYDRWVHAAAANSDAAVGMRADRCAGALFQGITPS